VLDLQRFIFNFDFDNCMKFQNASFCQNVLVDIFYFKGGLKLKGGK